MATNYRVELDDSWSTAIWPDYIIVSKPSSSEKSKKYTVNHTAYAQITLFDDAAIGGCHCSNCHKPIDQFYNYCCYCGAKIIGKQITHA